VKFCLFVAGLYPHILTDFGRSTFSTSSYRFYRFKFRVSTSQITNASLLMMSNPNSPNLNPLDYEVLGQYWSLNKSCNKSQNQFPSFKMHFS